MSVNLCAVTLCRYKRDDGIDMTATLYLPPGYSKEKDGPLPCLIWAYPREFKSKDAAGQSSCSCPGAAVTIVYESRKAAAAAMDVRARMHVEPMCHVRRQVS